MCWHLAVGEAPGLLGSSSRCLGVLLVSACIPSAGCPSMGTAAGAGLQGMPIMLRSDCAHRHAGLLMGTLAR